MRKAVFGTCALLLIATACLAGIALLAPGTALAQPEHESMTNQVSSSETTRVISTDNAISTVSSHEATAENVSGLSGELFLAQLRRRAAALDRREQAMAHEREALETLRAELQARASELDTLHMQINESLQSVDRERDKRMEELAAWYGAMEPAQAATQLETQPVPTVVELLTTMEQRPAAAILETFDTALAGQVAEEMSARR